MLYDPLELIDRLLDLIVYRSEISRNNDIQDMHSSCFLTLEKNYLNRFLVDKF